MLKNNVDSNLKLLKLYVSKARAACMRTYPYYFTYVATVYSLSFHAISLSYMLFHFPRVILIEQIFPPYILNGKFTHCTINTINTNTLGIGKFIS